jgi:hypothetical protein
MRPIAGLRGDEPDRQRNRQRFVPFSRLDSTRATGQNLLGAPLGRPQNEIKSLRGLRSRNREGEMPWFRGTLLATGLFGIAAAPSVAEELKAEGTFPGLSVVVQELKRDEANSVTLRFQLVNDSDKSVGLGGKFKDPSAKSAGGNDVGGVHLIDNVNKKKYLVVRDSTGKCACAEVRCIDKGGRVSLWAKFAAPPENVEKVTVVVPEFQPVDGVPISR